MDDNKLEQKCKYCKRPYGKHSAGSYLCQLRIDWERRFNKGDFSKTQTFEPETATERANSFEKLYERERQEANHWWQKARKRQRELNDARQLAKDNWKRYSDEFDRCAKLKRNQKLAHATITDYIVTMQDQANTIRDLRAELEAVRRNITRMTNKNRKQREDIELLQDENARLTTKVCNAKAALAR